MDFKMPVTDLHVELLKTKKRSKIRQDINIDLSLDYRPDKIDSDRVFHISDIKKICIDYRLRFLDFELFKGKVPDEAYKNLKSFYSEHKELKREIKSEITMAAEDSDNVTSINNDNNTTDNEDTESNITINHTMTANNLKWKTN